MSKTLAGAVLLILIIIAYNVYREGGTPAVRSWLRAKFLNRPDPDPRARARGRG